jgi:type IV secretion system protein VirB6
MSGFFNTMATQLLTPFAEFSALAAAGLANAALPAVLAGLSVNVGWQGLNLVRGVGGQHLFLDLFAQNLRAILVLLLALSTGGGYTELVSAASELETSLIGFAVPASLPGASATSTPAVLDAELDQLIGSYRVLLKAGFDHIQISALGGADVTGLEVIAAGSIVALALLLFMAFAFVEIIAVQAAIYMIVAIGPLFVAAAAFRETSGYFSGWLNGLLRYSIEIAFLLALVGIGLQTTGRINANLAADLGGGTLSTQLDLTTLLLQTVGTAVILVYLSFKVDSIAASVFGGASVSGAAVALGVAGGAVLARLGGRGPIAAEGQAHRVGGSGDGGVGRGGEREVERRDARAPGTGTIVRGGARQGIDTLGANWANDGR